MTHGTHFASPRWTVSASVAALYVRADLPLVTAVSIPAEGAPNLGDADVATVVALHQGQPLLQISQEEGEPQLSCDM